MTNNHIEEKRKELVGHWLYNLKNNIENEEVLFFLFNLTTQYLEDILNEFISNLLNESIDNNKPEYTILDVKKLAENKSLLKKNTILIGADGLVNKSNLVDLKNLLNLEKKALVYKLSGLSNSKLFLENLNINQYPTKLIINENEKYIFYLSQIKLSELIHKSSDTLKEFILNVYVNFFSIRRIDLQYLIKETNLNTEDDHLLEKIESTTICKKEKVYKTAFGEITTNSLQKEYLFRDIIILEEKGLLTSRLSIVLYRKAFLDINANVTEIGRYFNKLIGNKSKAIDLKKICKDSSINYDCLSKTKVKAYDLNVKTKSEKDIRIEIELEIKEHIAKKLIYFTNIDIETIQRIVELPMSKLKEYR